MGMNDFLRHFKGMGGKISSHVLAGVHGQTSPQNISFLRHLEKEVQRKDDLSCPLHDLEVVVFDMETTGFSPNNGDRIISIGAVKMRGCEIDSNDTFYSLLKTDIKLLPEITALTGITDTELSTAPDASDVLIEFFSFVSAQSLIAHHSKHEQSFMQKWTWELTRTKFKHRVIDTSFLIRLSHRGVTSPPLEQLCTDCGIEVKNRHHALGDAMMTAHLWAHYLRKAEETGFRNLRDVYSHIATLR